MKPRNLTGYSSKSVTHKLNSINIQINLQPTAPKAISQAQGKAAFFIIPNQAKSKENKLGYFNRARLVTSLIDFSFIRSMVADAYSSEEGNCYDLGSLSLCDLFRYLENPPSMKDFCKTLHDRFNGQAYRVYASIPCEVDFFNFRCT